MGGVQACMGELLDSSSARRVLLHLVSPAACRRLQSPAQVAVLEPRVRLRAPGATKAAKGKDAQTGREGADDSAPAVSTPAADSSIESPTEQVGIFA